MNLLFVVHNWVGYGQYGGTEVHIQSIVNLLLKDTDYQVYVLFPNLSFSCLYNEYLLVDIRSNSVQNIRLNSPITTESYRHQEFTDKFSSFILEKKIDIVHFFHLIKFPLNLPLIARISGAKTVVAFHDYYFVCPQFNLLKKDNHFCGYPNISPSTCDLCLRQLFSYKVGTQQKRRILISKILYHTSAVHYMCEDEKYRILSTYPHLTEKTSILMGVGLDSRPNIDCKINTERLPLKVAVIGNFDTNKGALLLLQLIDYYQNSNQNSILFNIYGDVRLPYSNILNRISDCKLVNLHGSYTPNQLPELTKDCHIAIFASIWPETFALTLSEAWSCALIPIAPSLGAFKERITDGKNGFLYNHEDTGSLIDVLNRLLSFQDEDFIKLLNEIANTEYPSLQYNLSTYLSLYSKLSEEKDDLQNIELISRTIDIVDEEFWHATEVGNHVNERNIFAKVWSYYKKTGLLLTLCRIVDYAKSRISKYF